MVQHLLEAQHLPNGFPFLVFEKITNLDIRQMPKRDYYNRKPFGLSDIIPYNLMTSSLPYILLFLNFALESV